MTQSPFLPRHIGPSEADQRMMLNVVGMTSIEALIAQTIPGAIRMEGTLSLPDGVGEEQALAELAKKMGRNVIAKPMIGQGYHNTHLPPVIQRNMLENPGWYTAYTPYQPEISQGRLEMLFHFQTLVAELTGLPVANASLLDEATAVAEAIGMAFRHHRAKRSRVVVANRFHPQTLDVVKTRGSTIGFELCEGPIDDQTCAVILQMPDTQGGLIDPAKIVADAKAVGALVIVSADPLSLVLLEEPAKWGVDICVGSMQRFGVPLGNGGPHAAYMATTEALTRVVPGRIIGESIDAHGPYIGAQSLAEKIAAGRQRMRIGLIPDGRPVRGGAELQDSEGNTVGMVTSGGFGPSLDGPMALGLVNVAAADQPLFAEMRGKKIPMKRTKLPFVPHTYKR